MDNKNAVTALINKDIRNKDAHALLVRICETIMKYRFEFFVDYIPSDENRYADLLSRLKIQQFKQLCNKDNTIIDHAPMLHERPSFQVGQIEHNYFPSIYPNNQ